MSWWSDSDEHTIDRRFYIRARSPATIVDLDKPEHRMPIKSEEPLVRMVLKRKGLRQNIRGFLMTSCSIHYATSSRPAAKGANVFYKR